MLRLAFCVTLYMFCLLTINIEAKRGFLFTSPSVLQLGSTEKACISFHDLPYLNLTVALKNDRNTPVQLKDTSLQNSGCFDLAIEKNGLTAGEYEVEVSGSSEAGYRFTDKATVKLEESKTVVFIQTDKPIYKPGQMVKLRILVADAQLRPRLDELHEIFIENPTGVRMMQWLNTAVNEYKGIANLQMPLSMEPVQGEWKISVRPNDGDTAESKTFKVEEYVLPKYEITVKAPSHVIVDEQFIEGETCAIYTYGEPVKGMLSMQICQERYYYNRWPQSKNELKCVDHTDTIKGCQPFKVDISDLELNGDGYRHGRGDVIIRASVLENATGVTLNSSASVKTTRDRFQLDFSLSPDNFKPGLPYYGQLKVMKPNGLPAPNEEVTITMNNYRSNLQFEKNFTSDAHGEVHFNLPPLSKEHSSLTLQAFMPQYDPYRRRYRRDYITPVVPRSYHGIKQWFSPSNSFILIEPVEEQAGCDATFTLNVTHTAETGDEITLYYKVMSHGDMLTSGENLHHYRDTKMRVYSPDGSFSEEKLYPDCESNMVWNECGSACTPTCDNKYPVCTRQCVRHCECTFPTSIWHNGRCIHLNECPTNDSAPECSGGRVKNQCASACTRTCDNQRPICTSQCVDRCECPTSAPLWHQNQCVTKERCPGYQPPPQPDRTRSIVSLPLRIPVTPEMSPQMKVLVYYVRDDGETVADSATVKVQPCTKNKVKIAFNEDSRYPGQEVTLDLEAEPGSVCSVAAVDKSVNLLGGTNTLTLAEALQFVKSQELNEHSIPGEDTYCEEYVRRQEQHDSRHSRNRNHRNNWGWNMRRGKRSIWPGYNRYYSDYYDSMHAFKNLGTVVLGVTLDIRPCEKENIIIPAVYSVQYFKGAVDSPAALPDAQGSTGEDNNPVVDVRTYFPETWLFDLHLVGDSGKMTLTEELPHTVTEWSGSGFCSHDTAGLGVSPPTAIKAFQPFFLSLTLPYSVIRGEVLKLPVTVFNYLDKCLVVKIQLMTSEAYRAFGGTEADRCVCGQESVTHYFNMEFKELGDIPIDIEAESIENSGVCGNELFMSDQIGVRDAVSRELLVEAEGREEEVTESAFMCPEGDTTVSKTIDLELPADYVDGTQRAMISTIGDIMGPTLSGLDRLIRQPTGCGEQNMILFAPNIFVMQYLTGTQQVTDELKEKSLGFMRTGYQRELTYRHDDGSYSAFGKNDESGSTWLTAFVVKSFAQAKQFIFIDEKDLMKSIKWFMDKQESTGCFPQLGKMCHKDMKGGVSNNAALTAYVLVSLLESKRHVTLENIDQVIDNAFYCLESQGVTDTYTMILMAYAYSLDDKTRSYKQQIMSTLEQRKIEESGLVHWTRSAPQNNAGDNNDGWHVSPIVKPKAVDVEMTAYMLLTYMETYGISAITRVLPIVKWLTAQRNAYGGFSSTQDTVVALQSLAKYAFLVYSGGSDLTVSVRSRTVQETFVVSDANRLLLQRKEISVPNRVIIDVSGSGCALVQSSLKYNVANISTSQEVFSIKASVTREQSCKKRKIDVCTSYEGTDDASNMAVVTVKMVSGWIPDKDSIKKLMNSAVVGLKRYEIDMNKVNFYFDQLTRVQVCLDFLVEQNLEVKDTKEASVMVYDYYDTEQQRTVSYNIRQTCGTKEELPDVSWDEYEERSNAGEQVRQPSVDEEERERIKELIREMQGGGDNDEVEVQEPLIVPEYVVPLGAEDCPVCLETEPEDLIGKFCNASKAYKLGIRDHTKEYHAKTLNDLRHKKHFNLHTKVIVPGVCDDCTALFTHTGRKALVLAPEDVEVVHEEAGATRASLTLNNQSIIFLMPSDNTELQNMEKSFRWAIKCHASAEKCC